MYYIIKVNDKYNNIHNLDKMENKHMKHGKLKKKTSRIIYCRYYFEDTEKNKRYLHNLNNILDNFCSIKNIKYKNSFIYNGEAYYIVPILGSDKIKQKFYYFISTKNNDIGKIIEKSGDIHISDIETQLNDNQMLGFSSYVMVHEQYIAFSSSNISPKYTSFEFFINSILKSLQINKRFQFVLEPFPIEITLEEALKFPVIGRTAIRVKSNSILSHSILSLLFNGGKTTFLNEFEIVAKPKRKMEITELGKEMLKKVLTENESDIKSVEIRAKRNYNEDMQDYIIFTSSKIRDIITSEDDEERCVQMQEAAENNQLLQKELKENEKNFTNTFCKDLHIFDDINSWNNRISNL